MPSRFDFPIGVLGGTAAAVLYTLDYFIGPEYTERSDIIRFVQSIAQMILFLAVAYAVVRIVIVISDRRKQNPRRPRRSNRSTRNAQERPTPSAPPNAQAVPEPLKQNAPPPQNKPTNDAKALVNDAKAPANRAKAPVNDAKAPANGAKASVNDAKAPVKLRVRRGVKNGRRVRSAPTTPVAQNARGFARKF